MLTPKPPDPHLWRGLLASWLLALEAENKSPRTLEAYGWGPVQLAGWLLERGLSDDVQALTTDHVRGWLRDLGATRSDNTVENRYKSVRSFLAWCRAEGELDTDPMANVPAPKVRETEVAMLTADQQRALLADMAGQSFADVRDRALVLLFLDTGARLSGITNLLERDVDLRARTARIVLKGGRPHVVPFGATTARALDKYLRAKRRQPYGERDWLWISTTGKGRLTAHGVQQMLRRRGRHIGVPLHPHMFRHTFADAWLSAGGGETDLMELAGWRSRQMLNRYGAARRAERAREAHRALSPMYRL
jgi:site-specific recombinase XerD